jgi:hypothetical protein
LERGILPVGLSSAIVHRTPTTARLKHPSKHSCLSTFPSRSAPKPTVSFYLGQRTFFTSAPARARFSDRMKTSPVARVSKMVAGGHVLRSPYQGHMICGGLALGQSVNKFPSHVRNPETHSCHAAAAIVSAGLPKTVIRQAQSTARDSMAAGNRSAATVDKRTHRRPPSGFTFHATTSPHISHCNATNGTLNRTCDPGRPQPPPIPPYTVLFTCQNTLFPFNNTINPGLPGAPKTMFATWNPRKQPRAGTF